MRQTRLSSSRGSIFVNDQRLLFLILSTARHANCPIPSQQCVNYLISACHVISGCSISRSFRRKPLLRSCITILQHVRSFAENANNYTTALQSLQDLQLTAKLFRGVNVTYDGTDKGSMGEHDLSWSRKTHEIIKADQQLTNNETILSFIEEV